MPESRLASQREKGYTASTSPGWRGSRSAFLVLPQNGCAQRRVHMCRVTPGMARTGAPQARPYPSLPPTTCWGARGRRRPRAC